jgi:hypothetical protein
LVAPDEVMLPLCKLQGLRDLFVHLSANRNLRGNVVEELCLERLAMGEGYHPTEEELQVEGSDRFLYLLQFVVHPPSLHFNFSFFSPPPPI